LSLSAYNSGELNSYTIFSLFSGKLTNIIVLLAESIIMRSYMITLLLSLLITMGITACGNKGPLTLPEEDKKSQQSE
jgi:hypothetical protein